MDQKVEKKTEVVKLKLVVEEKPAATKQVEKTESEKIEGTKKPVETTPPNAPTIGNLKKC